MTREDAIEFIEQVGTDLGFIDIELVVNKIYDEHESQMKDKDEEIEMLKKHVEHLKNVYIGLNKKYLKVKLELEELKDNA